MFIDVIVLAVLLVSALISFLRGFIREVLTILGVVGGLVAAYYGGPVLAPTMRAWLGVKEGDAPVHVIGPITRDILADILTYGAIFIIVVIILSIISHILSTTVKALGLGAVDRTLGVVFGLARGALLLGVLYLIPYLTLDAEKKKVYFEDSKTYVYLEGISGWMAEYVPESTVKQIEDSTKTMDEATGVKQQLEKIDLIGKGSEETPPNKNESSEDSEGYTDDFREKMDEVFQQGTAPPQPQTPPGQEQHE